MQGYRSEGNTLTLTAPSGGVSSGDLYLAGSLFGVVVDDAAEGRLFALARAGVFALPKTTGGGTAFAVGDPVYYDEDAGTVTPTATPHPVGYAVEAAADAATEVTALLSGVPIAPDAAFETVDFAVGLNADPAANLAATEVFIVRGPYGDALYSALDGAADITVQDVDTGDAVPVLYDADPATNLGGIAVFVKAGAPVFTDPDGVDAHVRTKGGKLLLIAHDAAPGAVDLFCDDDGAAAARFFSTAAAFTWTSSATRAADAVI